MNIAVTEQITIGRDPAFLFDFTIAAENLSTFAGYGPIPGIVRATDRSTPVGLGTKRDVEKSDGSVHVEELVVFDRPHKHVARITGLAAPLSWLVRYAEDEWVFRSRDDGRSTELDRVFRFELTTPVVAPLGYLAIGSLLRRAVRRDLRNIKARLEMNP